MEQSTDMEAVQLQFENVRLFPEGHRSGEVRLIIQMFEKYLNYTFVKFLGKGAFGDVVELLKPDGQTSVAIKIILRGHQSPMEVSMWPGFDHKNVQSVIEDITIEPSQARVYVMTMQMGTLSHILKTNSFLDFPDTVLLIRRWLTGILEGLNYLHKRKICHLDIKADNVLISYEMTAVLSDFSTIQSTEERTSSYGAPILCCPPETCPSRRFKTPVEGTAFDLWTVGMLALNMLTDNYIERRYTFVRSWVDDVYPLIFDAIEEDRFFSLVKTAHPSSCVNRDTLRDIRNFVLSFLVLDPDDRPSAQLMLDHVFLNRGEYRFLPDRIWMNKVSSQELKLFLTMLHDPARIESDTEVVSDGKSFCKNNKVSDDSCHSTDSSVQSKNIDKDHHEMDRNTTSEDNKDVFGEEVIEFKSVEEASEIKRNKSADSNIVSEVNANDDDVKDKKKSLVSINTSDTSSFVVVSNSMIGKINYKNTDSTIIKGRDIEDLSQIEIGENKPSSEKKLDLKEEQYVVGEQYASQCSGDSLTKSNFIPTVIKSDDKDIEKRLKTEADAEEPFGVELEDAKPVEKVEERPEIDNTGLKRKTLSKRIRGWFRKRWTGVRKCVICGFK